MIPFRLGEGIVTAIKPSVGSGPGDCREKKGARNCQMPEWLPEELEIIRKAWSVNEAVINHDLGMTPETPYRTFGAIKKCWMREHPKLRNGTDEQLKAALDKLAEVA